MSVTIDTVAILNGVILILVAAIVRGVSQVNKRLNELNGRLGKSEVWQEQHQEMDTKEFEALRREIDKFLRHIYSGG